MGPSILGDDTRRPNRDCASHSRCALDARIVCHHERAASFRAQTRGAPTDLREVIALGSHLWEPGHDEVARRHAVRVSLPNPTINAERSSGGHGALVDRFRTTQPVQRTKATPALSDMAAAATNALYAFDYVGTPAGDIASCKTLTYAGRL